MPPLLTASAVPLGGAINLFMDGYNRAQPLPTSGMILSRAVSGVSGIGSYTTLYSGAPRSYWIDPGDSLPSPLVAASGYVYRLVDQTGTTDVGPVYPVPAVDLSPDYLTQLFIRLVQCGLDNLTVPKGLSKVQISTQMPTDGFQSFPRVVVNLDLFQQRETSIGQDVPNPDAANRWTINIFATRVWRVTVFSANAEERDFYRDSLLGMFQVMLATVFVPLGLEMHHSIQASSGTDSGEWSGKQPGFYFADCMITVNGVFNTAILTNYGVIETITATPTYVPDLPPASDTASATSYLYDDDGALGIRPGLYPNSAVGLPAGALWSNGGWVTVVSGMTPDPLAEPVYFPPITAFTLQVLGGGNLPLTLPEGPSQLWNNNGAVSVTPAS